MDVSTSVGRSRLKPLLQEVEAGLLEFIAAVTVAPTARAVIPATAGAEGADITVPVGATSVAMEVSTRVGRSWLKPLLQEVEAGLLEFIAAVTVAPTARAVIPATAGAEGADMTVPVGATSVAMEVSTRVGRSRLKPLLQEMEAGLLEFIATVTVAPTARAVIPATAGAEGADITVPVGATSVAMDVSTRVGRSRLKPLLQEVEAGLLEFIAAVTVAPTRECG